MVSVSCQEIFSRFLSVKYSSYSSAMDLRMGTSPLGSPETAIISRTVAELCRYYQLPCMFPGISSDSKKADCQAIFEKMLAGVSVAISGADRIVGIGGLETGLTFDYGQAVLDDEMVCLIKHMAQDIEVSNESISTDLIDEVGHFGEF